MNSRYQILIGVLVGTLLEWYDFSLMASMGTILALVFFPTHSKIISLLAVYGVFASGFIMRPIGAVIFGYIGDNYGRRAALSLTLFLMALPTTLIGLLPDYKTIGVMSPILLIVCRLLQGCASSGEYPGAICFLTEIAPQGRRGLWGSLSMFGVGGGIALGSLVNSLLVSNLTDTQIYAWAWRVPFLIGLPLALIGLFLRTKVRESQIFTAVKDKCVSKFPLQIVLKNNAFSLFAATVLFSLSTISFYLSFVYIPAYLVSIKHITVQQSLFDNTLSSLIMIFMIPLFGYLSDITSRKYIMFVGAFALLVSFYPLFIMFTNTLSLNLLLGQTILALFIAMLAGPMAATVSEMFSTATRYSGVGLGLNLGASIFGGTSPFIATYLVYLTGSQLMPCLYPMLISLFCLVVIVMMRVSYASEFDQIW